MKQLDEVYRFITPLQKAVYRMESRLLKPTHLVIHFDDYTDMLREYAHLFKFYNTYPNGATFMGLQVLISEDPNVYGHPDLVDFDIISHLEAKESVFFGGC